MFYSRTKTIQRRARQAEAPKYRMVSNNELFSSMGGIKRTVVH